MLWQGRNREDLDAVDAASFMPSILMDILKEKGSMPPYTVETVG